MGSPEKNLSKSLRVGERSLILGLYQNEDGLWIIYLDNRSNFSVFDGVKNVDLTRYRGYAEAVCAYVELCEHYAPYFLIQG